MMKSPWHPIYVHFTIALTSTSFIFDLASFFGGWPTIRDIGWWTLAFATLSTVMALITGVTSRVKLAVPENRSRRYLRVHMALGPSLFGVLIAICVWRELIWEHGWRLPAWYFLGAAVTFILILIQAYIGGELVYRWGMEVRGSYKEAEL